MMSDLMMMLSTAMDYDFMRRALMTGLITALTCGLLSCWLVLIGWSLIGDALSHAVLPGVVISYIIGLPFTVGALIFALITVWIISILRRKAGLLKEDAILGTVFTPMLALGVVLISVTPSQTDLNHILFGNLLGVTDQDLLQVAILAGLTTTLALLKRRDLTLFAFDPVHARSIGISPVAISGMLLIILAVTVVSALQAVGVTLVVAMLIIPGVTARLITNRIWHMLWISPLVAAGATVLGVFASYVTDASTGGMIVLAQAAFFAIAYCFAKNGIIASHRRKRKKTPIT